MKTSLNSILAAFVSFAGAVSIQAGSVNFYDETFSLFNGSTEVTSGVYETKFGTWNAGTETFTPLLGNAAIAANAGYADVETPEWAITLSQNNNNNINPGDQLAIVVFFLDDDSSYASADHNFEAVLIDPLWVAPTFTPGSPSGLTYVFSADTTAVRGQFAFSGSGSVVNLAEASSVIPEPSAFAAIAGLGILGFAATRRRRVA